MRSDILDTFPPALRSLVAEIESHAGFEIEVASRSDRKDSLKLVEADEGETASNITFADSATIEAPGEVSQLSLEDYTHELLHLRRSYVERIPHLYPKNLRNSSNAAMIDNYLEHVVIFKKQIELCPGFKERLDTSLQEFWSKCPWGLSQHEVVRFNAISRYMVTYLYGGRGAKDSMKEALAQYGLTGVRRAARSALSVVRNKQEFVRSVFRYCQLRTDPYWLRHYDLKNKTTRWCEV